MWIAFNFLRHSKYNTNVLKQVLEPQSFDFDDDDEYRRPEFNDSKSDIDEVEILNLVDFVEIKAKEYKFEDSKMENDEEILE